MFWLIAVVFLITFTCLIYDLLHTERACIALLYAVNRNTFDCFL